MKLESADHPALWTRGRDVTMEDLAMHRQTISAMKKAVDEVGAAGLAFSQIGLSLRGFVTKYDGWRTVMNPRWEQVGTSFVSKPEKCLTRLDYSTYVRRPESIIARFQDGDGEDVAKPLTGMDARVFQHLTNLCDGLPIFPRPKAVA